ncbi:Gfo/Idh/MocA family protein [Micromonospora aurantiaca (nom. illeg.)]
MGVLGCADIAIRRLMPTIAGLDGVEVVAVASRSRSKAEQVAGQFGCAAVTGYRDLLKRDDVEAVYIPLPPRLHYEWVAEALQAGKHVLAEKPLCTTHVETVELMAVARERGRVLAENFMFLHHSQHDAVRAMVAANAIGRLQVFSSSFGVPPLDRAGFRYQPALGGGALLDVGVYPLRAAQLFLPELEVLAATLRYDETTGVDVAGSALLAAPDGVAVQLAFGFDHSYRCEYALWGSTGRIAVDRAFTPPDQLKPPVRVERQDQATELAMPADPQVRNAVRAFVQAVRSGVDGPIEERATLRQAQLVEAVRDVARVTGSPARMLRAAG